MGGGGAGGTIIAKRNYKRKDPWKQGTQLQTENS